MSTRHSSCVAHPLRANTLCTLTADSCDAPRQTRQTPGVHRWSLLSQEMSSKRGSLQAAGLDGAVYALGGFDSKTGLSSVELFDVRADRWRSAAAMTNARCYGAAAVHDGKVSTESLPL